MRVIPFVTGISQYPDEMGTSSHIYITELAVCYVRKSWALEPWGPGFKSPGCHITFCVTLSKLI